jgi:hypothetical protein
MTIKYKTDYEFAGPNGQWFYKDVSEFRDDEHAREWAHRSGLSFMGIVASPISNRPTPGSQSWAETNGDNR